MSEDGPRSVVRAVTHADRVLAAPEPAPTTSESVGPADMEGGDKEAAIVRVGGDALRCLCHVRRLYCTGTAFTVKLPTCAGAYV